ncbi:MAG TPA: GTP-binding protein [Aliidongia sp.]|nr:GTP-binding protein [Aliidongia sp.]
MTRTIPLDRYRNIGIMASLDAGRTTTTERLLSVAGCGDAPALGDRRVPNWIEQDNERDITQTSAATSCFWRDCRINIVELPVAQRQADHGALAVLDGAVLVIDGVAGLTPVVLAALDEAEARGIALLVFVNKLDRTDADLGSVVRQIAARGRAKPVLVQLPIGPGLQGLIDVVEGEATIWSAGFETPGADGPVPSELAAETAAMREQIVALVAPEADEIDAAALKQRLREAVLAGRVLPVLCGSAFRNRGVRRLLDAIVDYLPAPSELLLKAVAADGQAVARRAADDEPFAGLAFQTVEDPTAGTLTFVRIYSGVMATGGQMLNSITTSPERIGRMVRMHANHAEEIEEARAGDIVALTGLQHTTTGDTLCDPAAPVILDRVPASAGRAKH